jgi:hypothetical protein
VSFCVNAGVKAFPVLQTVQFPWRLLMLVALPSALLAGLAIEVLMPRWRAVAALSLGLLLVASTSSGLRPPLTHFNEDLVTPSGFQVVEGAYAVLGATSNAEWVPRTVGIDPWADLLASPWALDHLDGELAEPVAFTSSSWAHGKILDWRSDYRSMQVDSRAIGPVSFNVFYFPGWRAWIDGVAVPVRPSEPEGFLTIDIPSGTHSAMLRFERTALQRVAELFSLVGLSLAAFLLWRQRRALSRLRPMLNPGIATMAMAVLVVILWVAVWRTYSARMTFDGLYQVAHHLEFGDVTMEGYDLIGAARHLSGHPMVEPGEELGFFLYWRSKASRPQIRPPEFFVRIVNYRRQWAYALLNPLATDEPGGLQRSSGVFRVPVGLPPGSYRLEVGLLEASGGELVSYAHRNLFDGVSETVLTSLLVTEPTFEKAPDLRYTTNVSLTDGLKLMAYDLAGAPTNRRQLPFLVREVRPTTLSWSLGAGNTLRLTFLWRSDADILPPSPLWLFLEQGRRPVRGNASAACRRALFESLLEDGPTRPRRSRSADWSDTPPGPYRWRLSAGGTGTLGAPAVLGEVSVGVADPFWLLTPTEPTIPLGAGIELVKAEHASSIGPGERLHLMLYWWGRAPEAGDVVARLMLQDQANQSWGSVQGPLGGEGFPTRLWRVDERLRQWFRLPVAANTPSGDYRLRLSLIAADGRELSNVDVGNVSVVGRARRFDLPDGLLPVDASLSEAMSLRGYRLGDEGQNLTSARLGQSLPVLLAWQAHEQSGRNLAVSVQLVDGGGRLVAQHDGIPQEGRGPVPGWLPDEIVDLHVVRLPELAVGSIPCACRIRWHGTASRLAQWAIVYLSKFSPSSPTYAMSCYNASSQRC